MTKKEKVYGYILHKSYKPLTINELAVVLDVPKSDYGEFESIVFELIGEGKIVQSKRGRLKKTPETNILHGTLRLIKSGNAFVTLDGDERLADKEDIFIERENVNYALDGDTVSVRLLKGARGKKGKNREGIVLKVVCRGVRELVGTIAEENNKKIFLADHAYMGKASLSKESLNVKKGQKVVAKIVCYPDSSHEMQVCITEILGNSDDVSTLIECIIHEQKIPQHFSKASLEQAKSTKRVVTDEQIAGRVDYRGDKVITIDGADARDLDDAICVKKNDNGSYILYVHIADVSYYVTENSAIDIDACERLTSVYFPDRVIPMLPKELSNGICSLNEGENRLTMSLEMHIDKDGNVFDYKLCEGLICSMHRMTYTDVTAIIDGDENLIKRYKDIYEDIINMKELALVLKKRREKRGAIDFNFPEPKVILDEQGSVAGVKVYQNTISNEIIEQFMLIANETIAKHAQDNLLPFVYRVHEPPSEEKIVLLQKYLNVFDIPISLSCANTIKPSDIQEVVNYIKATPKEAPISVLCLRSMMKARYSPENLGHFGLSSVYYCHFTSPIRRYPDLAIHRILRESMKKEIGDKRKSYLTGFVERTAIQSSEAEIRATDAQREADKICACLYMQQFIGEQFDAVISSVTDFGLFVEVGGCIEGLVPMAQLCDDYYVYEEEFVRLRGEHTEKIFSLGDELSVRLISSDARLRRIDFEIVGMVSNTKFDRKKSDYNKNKSQRKNYSQRNDFRSFARKKARRKKR